MKFIMQTFNVGIKEVIIYFVIVNVVGFLATGIDTWKAKKDLWRTPEGTLMLICLAGGGIGTIAGMYTFRHKTKKPKFTIGMPTILIAEIVFLIYFEFFYK